MTYKKGKGKAYLWLMAHVAYVGDDCLRWPFCIDAGVGRGRMGHNGKRYWAHRLMCELAHGPAPADKPQVAHSCGNGHKACVNPRHLSWSDQSENHMDRRQHGTANTNPHGGVSKLPRETIDTIRALRGQEPQMTTAARFGISHANVRYWQKTTHEPRPYGTSPSSIARRQKRQQRATQ